MVLLHSYFGKYPLKQDMKTKYGFALKTVSSALNQQVFLLVLLSDPDGLYPFCSGKNR